MARKPCDDDLFEIANFLDDIHPDSEVRPAAKRVARWLEQSARGDRAVARRAGVSVDYTAATSRLRASRPELGSASLKENEMSNTIINWRFGCWHFQVSRDQPRFRLSRNDYHAPGGAGRAHSGWRWFEAY